MSSAVLADIVVQPEGVVITDDGRVETPLTDEFGSGWRGVNLYMDEYSANCVACHTNPELEVTGLGGDVGPEVRPLGEIYDRAELRAILVNAPAIFGEETAMPAFYVDPGDGLGTLLTAQQIEDIVSYLMEIRSY
ncbi:MAG: sulfur oxidation c-type cytochrome SoxX [Rubricella sp.]